MLRNSYLTNTENHCTLEREKAWHILAISVTIGRLACPEELASKCRLFNPSPDYVRYLCSIPNSPICLLENGLVTVSMVVVSAFGEFVMKVIGGLVPRIGIRVLGLRRLWGSDVRTCFRKRKGPVLDGMVLATAKRRLSLRPRDGEGDRVLLPEITRIQDNAAEEPVDIDNVMTRKMSLLTAGLPDTKFYLGNLYEESALTPLLPDSNAEFSCSPMANIKHRGESIMMLEVIPESHAATCQDNIFNIETGSNIPKPKQVERVMACQPDLISALPSRFVEPVLCEEAQISDVVSKNEKGSTFAICLEVDEQHNASPLEAGIRDGHSYKVPMSQWKKDAGIQVEICGKEGGFLNNGAKGDIGIFVPVDKSAGTYEAQANGSESTNSVNMTTLDRNQTIRKVESQATFPSAVHSSAQKQLAKSFSKLKGMHKNSFPLQPRILLKSLDYNKAVNTPKHQDQCKISQKFISLKQKLKQGCRDNMHGKENMVDTTSISPTEQLEKKPLPHFESFIIEEEEGSGGYGTVYRARRKNDGKRLAIKCPRVNAHKHHVNNELQMLERFGGRSFIIKYEGSFKSGNSECFVLEHVEHDRPEVLKKEIDLFQLQWYGYCLFRALACLHKQEVVHRDVKPGNFLFSRKLNKGYLIDFNLAMDLQQKYAIGSKSKLSHNVSFDHVPLPRSKSAPSTKDKNFVRNSIAVNPGATVGLKSTHAQYKNIKKRANGSPLKDYADLGNGNIFRSQGADGSGLTSTKDATSTRTPSAERLREPLPCLGRKELISLVQDAMQSPNHVATRSPASQRKRVTAPPGEVDSRIIYPSPMPLHSTGVNVAGAGLLKSKADGKQKREGSCVGTKGFRAPEVLFRSMHQGPKVDIWSAGVTLLYLMVGRAPFTGDPEQNIKDIAKLRGSEELWEVAKLHDRESSFPVITYMRQELLDIQSLPSMELQSWCKIHTKRPEFFKLIPRALFDLVDKCLTISPRLRISAEEALRHEFFTSCHESLRKQKRLRHGLSLDSAGVQSGHLEYGQSKTQESFLV